VSCTLRGAGTCTARAQVTAKVGRGLGLKVKRGATSVTVATASRHLKKRGRTALTLHFSRPLSRKLAARRTLALRFTVTSSAPRHRIRTVHRSVTIH
jgi:hypothetical protein